MGRETAYPESGEHKKRKDYTLRVPVSEDEDGPSRTEGGSCQTSFAGVFCGWVRQAWRARFVWRQATGRNPKRRCRRHPKPHRPSRQAQDTISKFHGGSFRKESSTIRKISGFFRHSLQEAATGFLRLPSLVGRRA